MLEIILIIANLSLLLLVFLLLIVQFLKLKPGRYEDLKFKKFPKISGLVILFSLLSMLVLVLISFLLLEINLTGI